MTLSTMHSTQDIAAAATRNLAAVSALDEAAKAAMDALPLLISSDSHVHEPTEIWDRIPSPQREIWMERLKDGVFVGDWPPGSSEPHARLKVQDRDGVQAEILFPNDGLAIFGLDDARAQEETFKVYNDWLVDFCNVAPDRFFGVTCVAGYDIDEAVRELHRGLSRGLTGLAVWQVPDPKLPFTLPHYEKLWAAAAEAKAPVHMHILTGHSYARSKEKVRGYEKIRGSVNKKQNDTINALFDIIFSGVLERHPDLRVVLSESECGWLPFILQQWDYYFERHRKTETIDLKRKPSEQFNEQVYCTWLEDYSGTRQFTWWGQDNLMWSNDFPHPNSTYPNSRENVIYHIGNLDAGLQRKLVRDNAIRLYGLESRLKDSH
jgi:predicted TIM-barrel fold metal-dependent hydrolase